MTSLNCFTRHFTPSFQPLIPALLVVLQHRGCEEGEEEQLSAAVHGPGPVLKLGISGDDLPVSITHYNVRSLHVTHPSPPWWTLILHRDPSSPDEVTYLWSYGARHTSVPSLSRALAWDLAARPLCDVVLQQNAHDTTGRC